MRKGVLIWGYLASFVLLLGAIFLNHNLNAGKVLYLTGFFSFNLGYLIPLFLVLFKENQENKIGLVLIFAVLGFITFLTGVSFFVVNWGGGIILIYVGAGILILAILTLIILSRRFYETHIDSWFPVLIFGVFIVGSLLIGMVHRHVMRAFTIRNTESIEMLESLRAKNNEIYEHIGQLSDSTSNFDSLTVISIHSLKENTTGMINYIENLKIELIKKVEGDEYKIMERKALENLVPVQSNVEINTVSRFMLKKNGTRASKLKNQLINYKQQILSLIPKTDTLLINYISTALNTVSYNLGERRFNRTWERQHFYNLPLITVLSDLSSMQMRIALVESELLNYFQLELSDVYQGSFKTGILSGSDKLK